MSAPQHLQERLASNCRITRHGDSLVPSGTWLQELLPAVQDGGGLTVGGLRVALGSSDAAVLRAAERVRACIGQPEWIATASTHCVEAGKAGGKACQALPPADWWQSPCGGSVYWQAAPKGGKGFAVRADGRLAPLDDALDGSDGWAGWRPACVVWCPVAKGQQLLVKVPPPEHLIKEAPSAIEPDSSKLQPSLLGVWQEVWVDPNAWAILRPAASVSLCGEGGRQASAADGAVGGGS
jgi:hypothetical protein